MNDRVVLYQRVSTTEQSTDRQDNDLIRFCDRENLNIIRTFSEEVSGMKLTKDRPELTKLLEFVSDKSNRIDGVVVTEISRLGRRVSDVSTNIEYLNSLKIYVLNSTNNQSTLNPDKTVNVYGGLVINIMASIANVERETIINRTRSGIRTSVLKGNVQGRWINAYGFDVENKQYVINQTESEHIKLMYDLYLQGNGTLNICNILNEKGIKSKTGKSWNNGTIYRMLTNPIYKGERNFKEIENGKEITHIINIPQIIDNDTFELVQNQLKSNKMKLGKNSKFDYIIEKDLIKCGCCGKNFLPHMRVGRTDNVYRCLSSRSLYDKCGNTSINIDKLTSSIWYIIRRTDVLLNNLQRNRENNSIRQTIDQKIQSKNSLEVELKKFEKQEKRLIEMSLNDEISKDIYTLKFNEIKTLKVKFTNGLKSVEKEIKNLIDFETKQNDLNEQLRSIKSNPSMMKKMVKDLVAKIVIFPLHGENVIYSVNSKPNPVDRQIVVQLHLFGGSLPIEYIISQRTNNIIKLIPNEFDPITMSLKRNDKEVYRERVNEIIHEIKIKEIK